MGNIFDNTIGVLKLMPLGIKLLAVASAGSVILIDLYLSKIPEVFYFGHELGQIWRSLALSIVSAFVFLFFIDGANRRKKLYFLIERQVDAACICSEIHTFFSLIAWSLNFERKDPEEDFDELEINKLLEDIDPMGLAPAVFYLKFRNYQGSAIWMDIFEQICLFFEEETKSLTYGSFLLEPEVVLELHQLKEASVEFREALQTIRFIIENNIDHYGASYLSSKFIRLRNAADSLHLAMSDASGIPKQEFQRRDVGLSLLTLSARLIVKHRNQHSDMGVHQEGSSKE